MNRLSTSNIEADYQRILAGLHRRPTTNDWKRGDKVRVVEGPFSDLTATVDLVHQDQEMLVAAFAILRQRIHIQLDFSQVEKV